MKNQDAVKSALSACFLDLKMKEIINEEESWAVTNYPLQHKHLHHPTSPSGKVARRENVLQDIKSCGISQELFSFDFFLFLLNNLFIQGFLAPINYPQPSPGNGEGAI
jgi:hypothetical protein